jgi:hypothetical protein
MTGKITDSSEQVPLPRVLKYNSEEHVIGTEKPIGCCIGVPWILDRTLTLTSTRTKTVPLRLITSTSLIDTLIPAESCQRHKEK